jgi:hypothetical protein
MLAAIPLIGSASSTASSRPRRSGGSKSGRPFKGYNLSAPNTTVNFTNPATFGKVSTSTADEGTTANAGGQGLMNITLSFRF